MKSIASSQRRALWFVTGAAVVLLSLLVGLTVQGLRQQAIDAKRSEFANLARVFDEHVSRIIKLNDQWIVSLRSAYESEPPKFSLSRWLTDTGVITDIVPQIGIIDKNGIYTMSSIPGATLGIDLSDREHFRVHKDGAGDFLFVSQPVLGRASGRWTIQLTRPVRDGEGNFDGVIVFSLDTEYFARFYESIDIGSTGRVMLFGLNDGVIRAYAGSQNGVAKLGGAIKDSDLMRAARTRSIGTIVGHDLFGKAPASALIAYRTTSNYPLVVAVGADDSDYLADFRSKLPIILMIGAIGIGAVLILGVWLDRRLAIANAEATARLQAQEDIRYHAAADAASDGIVSWTVDGEIRLINPAGRRIFGFGDGQISRNVYDTIFVGPDAGVVKAAVAKLSWQGPNSERPFAIKARKCDGTVFSAEISLSLWHLNDEDSVTMVARDISSRQAEEETRKMMLTQAMVAQKMEAIGTLAGGIAHDFNNVLGAMQGFIWLALRELGDGDRATGFLLKARHAGERAAKVVSQLLDFSRAGTEATEVVEISKLMDEIESLAAASIPATISCRFRIERDLAVHGNTTQIHQLLLNMLVNAKQAIGTDVAGRISVTVERMQIADGQFGGPPNWEAEVLPLVKSEWRDDGTGGKVWYGSLDRGNYVRITFADDGCGMNRSVLQRMFEPFFTTKPVGEGTGLGLSVLHGVVKGMHGGIVVKSAVNKGTTFELLFPAAEKSDDVGRKNLEAAPVSVKSLKILVVYDEPDLLDVAKQTLAAFGCDVVLAGDGREALRLFEQAPDDWDLIVSDLTMPHMAGDQLAEEIKRRRPNLPFILCTGRGDKIDDIKNLPIALALSKPVFGEQLIDAVVSVVG